MHVINFHYFGRLRKSPLYSRNHFELVAFPAAYPMWILDILPKFLLLSSVDSGREDLLGLRRPCPGFPGPDTLLLWVQSVLCSDVWPRRCSIEEIIVQFTFLCAFSPQLGAKPEKTVLGVPLYGRSFLLQNKANNGAIIVCTTMVAVTMIIRNSMMKIRWTRRGGDIWHKLRYFMLLKGHESRKETTPNRKQGALPPVCQFYHCHPIGPDIETSWSPIHLVPISALQSGLRSITSALHLVELNWIDLLS